MSKFIVTIMAGNCEKYIDLCIGSTPQATDKIVVLYDTSSKDQTKVKLDDWKEILGDKLIILEREYEHAYDKLNANQEARNYYLKYLKENFMGDWCLVMDADECLGDNSYNISSIISEMDLMYPNTPCVVSPRMIHFIEDLGHEDSTRDIHHVAARLFKIHDSLEYVGGEHPILCSKEKYGHMECEDVTIYHLAYCREMFYIKDRYLNHLNKSEIHSKDYLEDWYFNHLSGKYPRKELNLTELPRIIKQFFLINEDYLYFKDRRNLNINHIYDAHNWKIHFKPKSVLIPGDGLAIRTTACRIIGIDAKGFDISEYAVKNNIGHFKQDIYWQEDITSFNALGFDLVVVYDVMEHLEGEQIDNALERIFDAGERFLFSIPFIGDPNLEADKTHKTKQTREWWENKLKEKGYILEDIPETFLFRHQLIIARKNGL
jgi:hypothetical protein